MYNITIIADEAAFKNLETQIEMREIPGNVRMFYVNETEHQTPSDSYAMLVDNFSRQKDHIYNRYIRGELVEALNPMAPDWLIEPYTQPKFGRVVQNDEYDEIPVIYPPKDMFVAEDTVEKILQDIQEVRDGNAVGVVMPGGGWKVENLKVKKHPGIITAKTPTLPDEGAAEAVSAFKGLFGQNEAMSDQEFHSEIVSLLRSCGVMPSNSAVAKMANLIADLSEETNQRRE